VCQFTFETDRGSIHRSVTRSYAADCDCVRKNSFVTHTVAVKPDLSQFPKGSGWDVSSRHYPDYVLQAHVVLD
jgi:hypothetical protein